MNLPGARVAAAVLLVILLAGGGGCARLKSQEHTETFDFNLREYGAALRWGHYETARSFLRARDGSPTGSGAPVREDVRVTAYRVLGREFNADLSEALVLVQIGYYPIDRGVVKEYQEQQFWWYRPEEKKWYLDGDLPAPLLQQAGPR